MALQPSPGRTYAHAVRARRRAGRDQTSAEC